MDCPVCKNAMVVLELRGVEIDHCFGCGGIWLDAGELDLLIDDVEKSAKLLDSFTIDTKCTEAKRKCPICAKKMLKVVVGKDGHQLLIDSCKKKHGLWFDAGELEDILKRAKLDSDSKIQTLLADMFAENPQLSETGNNQNQ
ncbi:MAG: zf-TFIIB domain-containing protein [Sedimentisphaerales bacterium]|nr:zf-TFIIB domain-containing protein [Sedimentisphaerales bacterium]